MKQCFHDFYDILLIAILINKVPFQLNRHLKLNVFWHISTKKGDFPGKIFDFKGRFIRLFFLCQKMIRLDQ